MNKKKLIKYCSDENRVCPMPIEWTKILDILKIRPGNPGYLTPLILGGWDSTDEEKQERLVSQIEYAVSDPEMYEKLENFLLNLKSDEWYYKK